MYQVPLQILKCCGKQGEAVPTHQDWSVSTLTHRLNQLWGKWRLYKSYNHCPCTRPAYRAKSWPLARLQVLQNHGSRMFISLRGEVWKALSLGHCFSSHAIFKNSRKNNGQGCQVMKFWWSFAPSQYKSYNQAHTPGQHMWPNLGPWPCWPDSKCSIRMEGG